MPLYKSDEYKVASINSLRYKCISKLVSTVLPSSEADPILLSKLTSVLHRKTELIQHIFEYVILEKKMRRSAEISVKSLCNLLSTGGCYRLDLRTLINSELSDEESAKIVDTLARNCDHLYELDLYPIKGFPFKGKILPKLKHVICTMTSLEDPINIFSVCPKLDKLESEYEWKTPTDQEINTFFDEFEKLTHNKSQIPLRRLSIGSLSGSILIKLVLLLPNLGMITCNDVEQIFNTIRYYEYFHKHGRAPDNMNYQSLSSIGENISVSSAELQNAVEIFKRLWGLRARCPIKELTMDRILDLMPNLSHLDLFCEGDWYTFDLAAIGDFKDLSILKLSTKNNLVITTKMFLPVLKQIGHNLTLLELQFFDGDISMIGRYCPKLSSLWLICESPVQLSSCSSRKPRLMSERKMVSREQLETLRSSFSRLNNLVLANCFYENVVAAILTNVFDIRRLIFWNCEINDEQLKKLVENNCFSKLEQLALLGKHSVSKSYFNSLKNSLVSAYNLNYDYNGLS